MDKKSLINLCLDLVEMNTESETDMVVFEQKIKSLSAKIDSYIFVDQFSESQIAMLKSERDHLDRQINAYDRVRNRLREVSLQALHAMNQTKIKSDNGHTISIRKSHSVEITNVNILPAWAVELKVEKTANKLKLKEAMKEGEKIDGASLITKEYVVFK